MIKLNFLMIFLNTINLFAPRLLHRVLLYCPFYSGARRIGQAPTNNNSLGSGRPDEADQPREMVVVSGQPWATANVFFRGLLNY
jgi:hypothetical protein